MVSKAFYRLLHVHTGTPGRDKDNSKTKASVNNLCLLWPSYLHDKTVPRKNSLIMNMVAYSQIK